MNKTVLFLMAVSMMGITTSARAEKNSVTLAQIQAMADDFLLRSLDAAIFDKGEVRDLPDCQPVSNQECVSFIRERVAYPTQSQILDIVRACSGNFGNACVKQVLDRVAYPTLPQMLETARACKDNYGDGCVDTILDRIAYPTLSQMQDVARACARADKDCVKYVLDQTAYPTLSQMISAAKACGGQE